MVSIGLIIGFSLYSHTSLPTVDKALQQFFCDIHGYKYECEGNAETFYVHSMKCIYSMFITLGLAIFHLMLNIYNLTFVDDFCCCGSHLNGEIKKLQKGKHKKCKIFENNTIDTFLIFFKVLNLKN